MEFAQRYLDLFVPSEIIEHVALYEWPSKKFHLSLALDPYTIYLKSIVCRQIKKPTFANDGQVIFHAFVWSMIIRENRRLIHGNF
jgi:hypothetical protein